MAKLLETTLLEATAPTTAGLIPNVKVLGRKSRNHREYTDGAMKEAIGLYEGAIVYTNHNEPGRKHRPMHERFGKLRNVRFDEQKHELRGDLEHLTSHPCGAQLKEDVERKLGYFGLSHDADGEFHIKDGVKVVTRINKVNSVDLVSNPATAISLLEQEDAPAAAEANPADAAMSDAFSQAVLAVLQDSTLDVPGKVAKIQQVLESHEEITKPKDEDEKPKEGAQEQVTAASIGKLVEQAVAQALKKTAPRKYGIPAAGQKTALTEQTEAGATAPNDGPPKDKAALKKWLRR